jgi:hypothetical protein
MFGGSRIVSLCPGRRGGTHEFGSVLIVEVPKVLGNRRLMSGLMPGRQPQMMPTFVSMQVSTNTMALSPGFY